MLFNQSNCMNVLVSARDVPLLDRKGVVVIGYTSNATSCLSTSPMSESL